MKGALGISSSPVSQFHQTLLDGLEGVGGGEPYSEPSQQVEEAEETGESFPYPRPHPHYAWCCETGDL